MMKFIFVLWLIFVQADSFSQNITDEFNYKITYRLTYQPDSTNIDSRKSEAMLLYIGDEISRFSSAGKIIQDSLGNTLDMRNFNQASFKRLRAQMPETEFNYYIYKGIPSGKISYTEEIVLDNFRYTVDEDLFNWKILPETDSIAGFPVQKATTNFAGRNYTAWFTNEIPISEGPYKFSGLPGLIVKIGDNKNHYVFELTKFKKLADPILFTFKEEDFISTIKKKFLKVKEEFEKDPMAFINRQPGIKITYNSAGDKNKSERKRKERREKENNPIELE